MSYFKDFLSGRTAKTTPVDADNFLLGDSADSNKTKKVTWANIKATLALVFRLSTRTISAKTADYSVVIGDDYKIFTNTGAGGTVKFTLPASAGCTAGKTKFRFVAMDAQIIQIEPPGSDTLGIYNERDSSPSTASSGNPVGTAGTGFEYMDALYMGSGIWHGMGVGRWNV